MNITILGAGAWGTALAIALAQRHNVLLWGRNPTVIAAAAAQRDNTTYLPGFPLPANLIVTADFAQAIAHVGFDVAGENSLLIVASSVAGMRSLCEQLRGLAIPNIVWLCKGFEENTRLLPHQIVRQVLGDAIPAGALSGPSFAQEVARGLPCALAIATSDLALSERVVAAVHGCNIRVYSTDDMIGVEVGGAVKNIMAIATGLADGLHLGLNARAALITRGLAEITRLGLALGGRSETFMGLSGVGDLILTCTGDLSRNRKVGLALAQGKSLNDVVAELGHVAEGVRCAAAVLTLAQRLGVDMPITTAVAGVLFDGDAPGTMVDLMLARTPREESA
ncbi:NAD(P)H-dependent glycerol-3-phosphate dehydrogenase [Glaciimonas immobilis]|uniref:Glycerol-3-phosphate dehydrogenase [NAD(P)+] n=1 Tax=Glaciimonas immobilis TaxID=728004 RepID=A0A840RYU4_9BURK|nr:NAD(P)H-dependent glycerol-3-phosphate dehydrogenase [Glaciimonas immobilis]KAF3997299.1 NAD(P)-dependent glycerol-3-phosphate dehydrogenase [Glaciimonas immobilis]MBB5202402.1 glycerol-3-phosphate dehydrogenase (NAD(P)+) [Glaciimonas immobilis]